MLLLQRHYQNLLGEPIRLDIYRFTNCCQIMITKTSRRTDALINCILYWFAVIVLIVSLLLSFNINKILDRLIIISIAFLVVIAIVYWRTPVYRESVVLLDGVSGLELTEEQSVLSRVWKRSHFILSADIIINEAITMHRVVYYLVSIPLSLSSLLSDSNETNSKSDLVTKTKTRFSQKSNNKNKLIPLFSHTCPRLDCLKVMYKHIQEFKSNTNRVNPKKIFEEKLNNSCIKSFSSTKSLSNRRNGYKNPNQIHKQN